MEKINVAELLKNCPQGMELYSPIYGVGVLTKVTDRIHVKFPKEHNVKCFRLDGKVSEDGEIMLYPKGGNTWEGFVPPCKFKDGDIIFTHSNFLKRGEGNFWISIFKEKRDGGVVTYVDYAENICDFYSDEDILCMESDILRQRFATEEEKQRLFDVIKANGYKWNAETKTLEKLHEPKFKVGDRIIYKGMYLASKYGVFSIDRITEDEYVVVMETSQRETTISIQDQNKFMIAPEMRLILEKKFDITTLQPFDKVLVRGDVGQKWIIDFFSFMDNDKGLPFVCVGHYVTQCIPYEGNEHLAGKTEDCSEFYKTWE